MRLGYDYIGDCEIQGDTWTKVIYITSTVDFQTAKKLQARPVEVTTSLVYL